MKIFSRLYELVLTWAAHPRATRYLAALSFAESSFFPIPPDVMLAPMVLAQRQRAWVLATVTTVWSVLGGVAGYLIGMFLFNVVAAPLIQFYEAETAFEIAQAKFQTHGVWIVFLAGFTPIPYKLFTISAGLASMSLLPFVAASLVGRGARFFLVAALIYAGGDRFEGQLRRYADAIGWTVLVLAALALLWLYV
ncbi:MAG: DedA family protein [Proteobacteria bacterium]|jgi:membrane protein YqaA with SNARE-associated domain|nr:DedA family protein [Pseudomonadota bacterium]MBT5819212.1 DedA family protein [Pseudomonadota bacterium]MBT6350327.1 DedA family protein [Pseudomonadota bacterium]MCH1522977.1 DedA family protein [Arenicellales bacterium]|tara:strand:+ start:1148 stop:1729 length:582 start_codon:yes stop_codon:yes gene_type:complete